MEQDRAVRKMMLDIKLENIIPEVCYPFVRERLKLMWLVGFEAKQQCIPRLGSRKPVRLLDKQGQLIDEFDCVDSLSENINVLADTIQKAITRGSLIQKRYYVRYV